MAGHSKWAQIKRSKAVKDAKRGAVFARLSREIMVAAKMGGGDPAGNFRLRTAIEKAKVALLPADNIQRAIDKGCGRGEADNTESLTYEGYGPGGVAILIETITDNRNRTAGDIRSYFNKYQGNLGSDGCVAWIFEVHGIIRLHKVTDELALMELAMSLAHCEDVDSDDDGPYLKTLPQHLNAVCVQLASMGQTVASAEVTRLPVNTSPVTEVAVLKPLLRLLDSIEDQDDVQAVYTNASFDDAVLQQFLESQ
jgi:YebC/PmpR family DNA-binding regulatory protein